MDINIKNLVLWQDPDLIIINKPPRILTLPDRYDSGKPCLLKILMLHFGKLFVIHRLDFETSGVMIFAKTKLMHRELNIQFQDRKILKIYHALISGTPGWNNYNASFLIKINGDRKHRTVLDTKSGKVSFTEFNILECFKQYTLLEAIPKTGYTHQIRAHLSFLGLPVAGDLLYRKKDEIKDTIMKRSALHAWSIKFYHPVTKKELTFQAKYPEDFNCTLQELRKNI